MAVDCPGCLSDGAFHLGDCPNVPVPPEGVDVVIRRQEGSLMVEGLADHALFASGVAVIVFVPQDDRGRSMTFHGLRGDPFAVAQAVAHFLAHNRPFCDIVLGTLDMIRTGRLDGGEGAEP